MVGRRAGAPSVSSWPLVEFGAYLPDVPDLVNPGMPYAKNVLPKANGFYGPARSLEVLSSNTVFSLGLPLKINGTVHSYKDPSGNGVFYYAGSCAANAGDGQLFRYTERTTTWDDVSKSGGYTVEEDRRWRFANMGKQVIACCDSDVEMQYLADGATGSFGDLAADAPRCFDIAVVNPGFLVAINIVDDSYGGGSQPFRVWRSGIGDPTSWPQPATTAAANVQSGFDDLFGGGRLRRIFAGIGGNDAVIVGERHIWRMNYVGPPNVYDYRVAEYDQGTTVDGSCVALNETLFFYGHGGFYAFAGADAVPIGRGQVDDTFAAEVEFSSTYGTQRQMEAGVDTDSQTVFWTYRTKNATTDFNNRLIAYNIISQRWSPPIELGVDAFGRVDNEISATDSPILVAMGQDFHTQRMTGNTLEAEIEARESAAPNGVETTVKSFRPIVDADEAFGYVRTRDRIGQTLNDSIEAGQETDGTIPTDADMARYFRARTRIPKGIEWSDAVGIEYETAAAAHGPGRAA